MFRLIVFSGFPMPSASSSRVLFFFFYCCGDHRDLHSFPTRRSSDLWQKWPDTGDLPLRYFIDVVERAMQALGIAHVRSEEHTSELQSLTNLVCRLLLEKKKQKKDRLQ